MTYAIIATGGKQLRVEPGRFYDVERLPVSEEETVDIDQVLLISHEGAITVGRPLVSTAVVKATIMSHPRGRKIIVYKMRPKKKTRKKQGHRQELTRIMIDAITLEGNVLAGTTPEVEAAPTTDVEAT